MFTPGQKKLISRLQTKDDSFCPYPLQAGNGTFLVFICICCAWEPDETYLFLFVISFLGCAQPFLQNPESHAFPGMARKRLGG